MVTARQLIEEWTQVIRRLLTDELELLAAIAVLIAAFFLAIGITRLIREFLDRLGVPTTVEGTPFERTAQRFGTSTVTLLAQLSGLFVFSIGVVLALRITGFVTADVYVVRLADFLPDLFVAVIVLIFGLILGDKAALVTGERLRSVKLPEISLVPTLVKYSIIFISTLIALSQLGVATTALHILLAAYAFGVVFLGGLACWDLLSSAAAGVYLLLSEPYAIGDRIEIDGKRGIVQEVDVLVTRIEREGEEFVIPNREVFRAGIIRVRT
jgi:small-conductance mechanosensitive channel